MITFSHNCYKISVIKTIYDFRCLLRSANGKPSASSGSELNEDIQWITAKLPAFNQARLSLNDFFFFF